MKLAGLKMKNDRALQRLMELSPHVFTCSVRAQVARDLGNKVAAVKWLRVMLAGIDRLWGDVEKLRKDLRREIKYDKLIKKSGGKLGKSKKRKLDVKKIRRVRKEGR